MQVNRAHYRMTVYSGILFHFYIITKWMNTAPPKKSMPKKCRWKFVWVCTTTYVVDLCVYLRICKIYKRRYCNTMDIEDRNVHICDAKNQRIYTETLTIILLPEKGYINTLSSKKGIIMEKLKEKKPHKKIKRKEKSSHTSQTRRRTSIHFHHGALAPSACKFGFHFIKIFSLNFNDVSFQFYMEITWAFCVRVCKKEF